MNNKQIYIIYSAFLFAIIYNVIMYSLLLRISLSEYYICVPLAITTALIGATIIGYKEHLPASQEKLLLTFFTIIISSITILGFIDYILSAYTLCIGELCFAGSRSIFQYIIGWTTLYLVPFAFLIFCIYIFVQKIKQIDTSGTN